MTTTLFMWGYYGWGNATPQLVEAVDAVEASRGFQPPIFVDIRVRRTVRAKGFQGSAFEFVVAPPHIVSAVVEVKSDLAAGYSAMLAISRYMKQFTKPMFAFPSSK